MEYKFGDKKIPAKIWGQIQIADNGCWHWAGPISDHKYSRMHMGGVRMYGHRYMYAEMVGPIPAGLVIDHVCHNADLTCAGQDECMHRRCVNPAHLEAITNAENVLRSTLTEVNRNAAKTHCIRGHEFTNKNTYMTKAGTRYCRPCGAEHKSAKGAKDRDAYLQGMRDYYAMNAEVLRAKKLAYDNANREEKRRKAREWYHARKNSAGPLKT